MWVKKNKDELQEDQRVQTKIALKYGVWTFIASISLLILKNRFIGTGGFSGAPWDKPITWQEINHNLFLYTVFSFLLAIAAFKAKTHSRSDTQICDKCGKIKNEEKTPDCQCGGSFIDIDLMKYVE